MKLTILSVILAIAILVGVTVFPEKTNLYKQGYQAGRQSVLDELHAKTDSLILQTDSLLFPDNKAYEAWMKEMLRRKNKEK